MKVYSAICIEDWAIEAKNGDRQECKRGEEYTVSGNRGDGNVMVFSSYWVLAPMRIFGGFKTLRGDPVEGVPAHA